MVTHLKNKRGFNSVDTAVTIGLVGLMAVGMAPLVRRGMQARIKAGVEDLGKARSNPDFNLRALEQYEPYYAETKNMATERKDAYTETYAKGKYSKTGNISDAVRDAGGEQIEHGHDSQDADNAWK